MRAGFRPAGAGAGYATESWSMTHPAAATAAARGIGTVARRARPPAA